MAIIIATRIGWVINIWKTFKVKQEHEKERLDIILSKIIPEISRSASQKLISKGLVKVNDAKTKANYKLKENDRIDIFFLDQKKNIKPENIELDLVYEDDDILIVNKKQGMVVHPAPGNYSGTLVNALLHHCNNLSRINGDLRPGIVHRIDKDTSGLLVIAKNDLAHIHLAKQLKDHSVTRIYKALVHGNLFEPVGVIKASIGRHPIDRKKMAVGVKNSKVAETHFSVLEKFQNYTFLEASLKTGRTHQIRVHMKYINHPIVGDPVYSKVKNEFDFIGQALHAEKLGFIHPRSGQYLDFAADIPNYFIKTLETLRGRRE